MNDRIGIIVPVEAKPHLFEAAVKFGVKRVELNGWNADLYTPALAESIRNDAGRLGIKITAFWAGWPGPKAWDFISGPDTLGIVPPKFRPGRIAALKKGADFAHLLGLPAIITHLGFIPENASDPAFKDVVGAVKDVANYLADLGMEFWFETGQETPVTMLRLIQEVGTGNLGINLDPANLILYGKANPVDALDVFGAYVRSVHAKDGLYPTTPYQLGEEVKIGSGKVNFPFFSAGWQNWIIRVHSSSSARSAAASKFWIFASRSRIFRSCWLAKKSRTFPWGLQHSKPVLSTEKPNFVEIFSGRHLNSCFPAGKFIGAFPGS